jgi:hypothetical protein
METGTPLPPLTMPNSLVCLAIVIAYLPQYIAIWRASSVIGISSHYSLHHALFSTTALCIRFANDLYYDTFNCVNNSTLRGRQATSALTGYLQVVVQWACAMVLCVLSHLNNLVEILTC